MPYFLEERPPLASEAELRAVYALLPRERALAMYGALNVLDDLETHQNRFTARAVKAALTEHGFTHVHTAPHGVEIWAPRTPPANYNRGAVPIPDPERGFADTASCILDMLWALAQAAQVGMVEATARVLAVRLADDGESQSAAITP